MRKVPVPVVLRLLGMPRGESRRAGPEAITGCQPQSPFGSKIETGQPQFLITQKWWEQDSLCNMYMYAYAQLYLGNSLVLNM